MSQIDETHAAELKSWVESANDPDSHFPIQNLPYGIFSTTGDSARRVGVAIGDAVLDLAALEVSGLLAPWPGELVFSYACLNDFMSLGPRVWQRTRETLSALLRLGGGDPRLHENPELIERALISLEDVEMHLPIEVPGYTDFYASKEHATNVGTIFRGAENALPPNWLHLPIGYNGRASTIVVSGTPVRRPLGQIHLGGPYGPTFSASQRLDFELEIGAVVGQPTGLGETLTISEAAESIFGYVILNDWSARDIQQWEYQPLGPFQAKVFATSISPWIVTSAALAPFQVAGPEQVPAPLPYLSQSGAHNYDVHLEVALQPDGGSPSTISRSNYRHMYWSSSQQLAHHAIGGCEMQVGDILGSGTISGPEPGTYGSMLELAWNGATPVALEAGGGERSFIEDGDTISMTGWCQGDGHRIGFGQVHGQIEPALSADD